MSTPGQDKKPTLGAEHRTHARHSLIVAARLSCGEEWQTCEVVNVSVGGAKLRVLGIYCPGQEVSLEIKACGSLSGVVAWVRGDELGLTFTCDPEETAEALIGLATYG